MNGDVTKAIKCFSSGVQRGSLLSAYELGMILLKEPLQCPQAIRHLASVIERSSVVGKDLVEAHAATMGPNPDFQKALVIFEKLAWAGVEEAQANAAYIHHRKMNNLEMAIRYYVLSAEQSNAHSHLILGDYYYQKEQFNISVTAYRRAADLRHHEAMYNLGYMYQHGVGVPQPDIHLAKRYYDMSLEVNPSSMYAVYLSLAHLFLTTGSFSSLLSSVDLWFWWSDGLALTLLILVLTTLLILRAR